MRHGVGLTLGAVAVLGGAAAAWRRGSATRRGRYEVAISLERYDPVDDVYDEVERHPLRNTDALTEARNTAADAHAIVLPQLPLGGGARRDGPEPRYQRLTTVWDHQLEAEVEPFYVAGTYRDEGSARAAYQAALLAWKRRG